MGIRLLAVLFLLLGLNQIHGQKLDSLSEKHAEIMGMVSLYRYMLNTVGDSETPTYEKETIITNSFKKIFRDGDVQIEDDLQPDRSVILNKSVSGYLRDIDFFFHYAHFDFTDIRIDSAINENGNDFYRVSLISTLKAKNLEDSSVNRTYERFIEINSTRTEGLKIVSVYSTLQDPIAQLNNWWKEMDTSWQAYFQELLGVDSMTISSIQEIIDIDSLDISSQDQLTDLKPLSELRKLIYLNVSDTKVLDLMPMRYASNLVHLEIANTYVANLKVLVYLPSIQKLNVSGCRLLDHQFLMDLPHIKDLNLSNTSILDFEFLGDLTSLKRLQISGTVLSDSEVLSRLVRLEHLDLSNTSIEKLVFIEPMMDLSFLHASNTLIEDVDFVSKTPKLKELYIEYTDVHDLTPVLNHPFLSRVYADFTQVNANQVNQIMTAMPGIIILTGTDELISWWNELPNGWKQVLENKSGWKSMPTIEDLIVYHQTDSLDVSDGDISDGKTIGRFKQLVYLDISNTGIKDLSFIKELQNIKSVRANGCDLSSLQDLYASSLLEEIRIENTTVKSLASLSRLYELKRIYAENSLIPETEIISFVSDRPDVTVVYRSTELISWWDNLYGTLKSQLRPLLGDYNIENLHDLTMLRTLDLKGFPLRFFDQLEVFVNLQSLIFTGSDEAILPDLSAFKYLDSLAWERSPLASLETIEKLETIRYLNVSNTAIEDLEPLASISSLKGLDCSGTRIKSLKPLKELDRLNYLNISNTRVWQLNWLYDIRGINQLVCFNTRVSDRQLEQFKERFPTCAVVNY
jgi:hypothetical protein